MKIAPEIFYQWPEAPDMPPPGQAVLIRVDTGCAREVARRELRSVLRRVLVPWSALPPERLPLEETARGPVWMGKLQGQCLDFSLSYGGEEGWIGLLRGGSIGLDVMPAQPIDEMVEVARHYLPPSAVAAIQRSPDPALTFALAWTELEARLKCLKRGLTEWSGASASAMAGCHMQSRVFANRRVATVATHFSPA